MIDLLMNLVVIITGAFIGLFLGRYLSKLKFEKEQVALKERNLFLNDSLNEITEDLKNIQLEKEALIATKTRLATELKSSENEMQKNK